MTKNSDNTQYKLSEVLALFETQDGYEPWSTREVADELGSTRRTALTKLTELEESNEISSKKVGKGNRGALVWWRSAAVRQAQPTGNPAVARARIDQMQFPARSAELLSRRQKAVGAAYDYLYNEQTARASEIMDTVYQDHPAGYDSAKTLWRSCLRPGLEQLGFTTPAPGRPWKFIGRTEEQTGLYEWK